MKILVAEDDATSALVLQRTFTKAGYHVTVAIDGAEAWDLIRQEPFDALLTDWMMPRLDGIELIRRVRAQVKPAPLIMVLTALASAEAKAHALDAGADEYLAKPFTPSQVLTLLGSGFARRDQPVPRIPPAGPMTAVKRPPFVGIGIAASTGGPEAVATLVRGLPATRAAAFFVVVHGPAWMLESFATRLQKDTQMPVVLAADGASVEPGTITVAAGNRHLLIEPERFVLRLADTAPENFVRPAADPLFKSLARAFGPYCIAAVLTGLGRDGAVGAAAVADAGGVVIAQDPADAVAASMPRTVIELGLARQVAPLAKLAESVAETADRLAATMRSHTRASRAGAGASP